MSGNASDYLENQIINHLMRTGTWSKTTARYVSLHLEGPYDDASGEEVSGGSYARAQLDADDANWSEEDPYPYVTGTTKNLVDITFPSPTSDWGLVVGFGVWDAPTGGNMLVRGTLDVPLNVVNGGAAPVFPTGALTIVAS